MSAAEHVICTPVQEFGPRQEAGGEGILVVGRRDLRRSVEDLRAITEKPLTDLVCRTIQWGAQGTLEARVGDFRFLILEFTRADRIINYVQIWSAPTDEVIMEVGPGNRPDTLEQAFADRIAQPLASRGFEIGGNANNFRKLLPVPRSGDSARIGREMLAIVTDVLGYDGSTDLTYTVRQSTYYKPAHVISGISRSSLQTLLKVWGLVSTASSDDPTVLDVRSHGMDFRIHLFVPKKGYAGTFWEVHCRARFAFPRERLAGLLTEVNGNPWLVKACPLGDSSEEAVSVALSYGFNLAGGVTADHLKSQLFEWLENVRRLWSDWSRPSGQLSGNMDRPAGVIH